MRTRFAPAPTGHLHLGHVHNAIHVWEFARAEGARVVLRIEDHDRQRARSEFELSIRKDLEWLGFHPDEDSPRQSERSAIYGAVVADLARQGLVYGCACSRQDLAAAGDETADEMHYPGTCRDRGIGLVDGRGWRVRIEPGTEHFVDGIRGPASQDPSLQCGDVLVRDRLGNWTYQFAVAIDDYLQDISHVIRGADLFASTGRQIRLARMAGRVTPASFRHHGLIMRTPTQKLSKSDGDTGIGELRRRGWTASDVIELARRAAVTS